MNMQQFLKLSFLSLCGFVLVGCSRENQDDRGDLGSQDCMSKIKEVAPTVPVNTAVIENLDSGMEKTDPVDDNLEHFRALVRTMLDLDADGRLNKGVLDQLMEQMPQGGSICGIGDVLCQLATSADVSDRMDALTLLAAIRRDWTAESCAAAEDGDDLADRADIQDSLAGDSEVASPEPSAPTSELNEVLDLESAVVMNVMTTCLTDTDASVRSAALETALSLPAEERDALSLQILGNDDVSLKLSLLSTSSDPKLESNVMLNFHGLDSEDQTVRQLASDNLVSMLGTTFKTSEEAFEWWEASGQSLEQ